MVNIIEGNLFDSQAKFICHQVNCQGKMGSGVALQVRQKYPHVYEEYKKICSSEMLGNIQLVPVSKKYIGYDSGSLAIPSGEQWICNMFAQDNYGYDGGMYTSLLALEKCMIQIWYKVHEKNTNFMQTVAMPYKIGCCRGGADWGIVYRMICDIFKDCNIELWKFDKG